MKLFKLIGIVFGSVLAGLVIFYRNKNVNKNKIKKIHEDKTKTNENLFDIGTHKLYAKVKGEGKITVIIETGLGSPSSEWWKIQDKISEFTKVVTYDRGGYSMSEPGPIPRDGEQISNELYKLLKKMNITPPYIIIGHSLGALFAQYFTRLYSKDVVGIVLIDPLIDNRKWIGKIDEILYNKFIDKTSILKSLAKLWETAGVDKLVKFLPSNIPSKIKNHVLENFSRPESLKTILDEYKSSFTITFPKMSKIPFPSNIPLRIIYHSPQKNINELVKQGATKQQAKRIESIGEQLTKEYIKLSNDSKWIIADKSSQNVHLDQEEIIIETVKNLYYKL